MSFRLAFLLLPARTTTWTRERWRRRVRERHVRTGFRIISGGEFEDGAYCTGCACKCQATCQSRAGVADVDSDARGGHMRLGEWHW